MTAVLWVILSVGALVGSCVMVPAVLGSLRKKRQQERAREQWMSDWPDALLPDERPRREEGRRNRHRAF